MSTPPPHPSDRSPSEPSALDGSFAGFTVSSYGAAFADVYDNWYADISDVAATVTLLRELAAEGPVLELGVGTGRIAVPLAAAGVDVTGIDISPEMLAVLKERDPQGRVTVIEGDMVDDLPHRRFAVIAIPYNTVFNLTNADAQRRLFDEVSTRLVPGGRFVVEAFVPDDAQDGSSGVTVRSMSADQVVLSVSRTDPDRQRADGQFVEFTEAGVRLRPWSIRYLTTDQLDQLAADAGMTLEHRWESAAREQFSAVSNRHLTVYRRDP